MDRPFPYSFCRVSKILDSSMLLVIVRLVLVPTLVALFPIAVSFAQSQFTGTYEGSWTGIKADNSPDIGTFTAIVANGLMTGTTSDGDSFSGTVSASGAITGTTNSSCINDITGQATITPSGGVTMAGTYAERIGTTCTNNSSGTWTATRTATTSVFEQSRIPAAFTLSQSYPNPFNPTAKIEFSLQVSGFTSLKVYDLLGMEVATLVNEELGPGSYKATWDASGFRSGVYFYRLTAGGAVETKKLLLLK